MSRILAWSDLHSEEHEDFSYQLPDGMNSRLADCLNVIDRATYYYEKYDCDVSLFCGDLFHTPSVLSTKVFQETYKRLEKHAAAVSRFIVLAGNHDMASITADGTPVSTVYAIRRLRDTTVVVGKYVHDVSGIQCLPYIKDKDQLERQVERLAKDVFRGSVIATHIGIAQAKNGPNEIMLRTAYDINKLRQLGARKILSGHHHHPQDDGDWSVIGSPLQMNMLDRGDKRGFLIYDTEADTTTRVWLRNSRFHQFDITSPEDMDKIRDVEDEWRGGYVRVNLTQGVMSEAKVQVMLASAKLVKILTTRNTQSALRSAAITTKAIANVGNLAAVIPDYVEHVPAKGLNPKRLISVGRRLLRG